ncbi:MAG: TIGR04283 family arsenosugar biosynthesis glycosyltransferase [Thermodesulfobacteriota bacterium]
MTITVIVPALDEAHEIEHALRSARAAQVVELLVVDGGSADDTVARARALADQVLDAPRGRALQMNAGAARARGDVLLFLHADTRLPAGFADAVERAVGRGAIAGRFDVELRGAHPFLPAVAWLMNQRSRWTGISTGDQAIFVRRDVFARLGGFAPIPLMEDVELSARLRRTGKLAALRERVSTSARRWEDEGVLRTIVLMWRLRLAYACGASPDRLAEAYRRRRR